VLLAEKLDPCRAEIIGSSVTRWESMGRGWRQPVAHLQEVEAITQHGNSLLDVSQEFASASDLFYHFERFLPLRCVELRESYLAVLHFRQQLLRPGVEMIEQRLADRRVSIRT